MDVPAALRGIAAVLRPGGTFVLEYANKRNHKAIVRYLFRQQRWSPFALEPYEFVRLNFDFHPTWMAQQLVSAGFRIDAGRAVSHFRYPLFKRLIPARLLAGADGLIQRISAAWKLSPSVFLRTHIQGDGAAKATNIFRCPSCCGMELVEGTSALTCQSCGAVWQIDDGIYDFKSPLNGGISGSELVT
jgi:hypothetical protein